MTPSTYSRLVKLASSIWNLSEDDLRNNYMDAFDTDMIPSYERLGWFLLDEIRMAVR